MVRIYLQEFELFHVSPEDKKAPDRGSAHCYFDRTLVKLLRGHGGE